MKTCTTCGTVKKLSEFHNNKTASDGKYGSCKKCRNTKAIEKGRKNKVKAILHKGGKCSCCNINYDGSNGAIFDFHHLNPNEKEVDPAHIMKSSWESIKEEIDKCVLLCSNCHRLTHSKSF